MSESTALLSAKANPELSALLQRVAFLGDKGSYSYLATQKYFSRRAGELLEIGCDSFADIIEKVETNQADYAVLPIENTSSGSINEVYDQLQHTRLHIVGELTSPYTSLFIDSVSTTLSDIKTLYAHPQVFAQCSHFLANLSDIEVIPADSSSAAMLKVAELNDPAIAAIGSEAGGKLYGLSTLESNLIIKKKTILASLSLRKIRFRTVANSGQNHISYGYYADPWGLSRCFNGIKRRMTSI